MASEPAGTVENIWHKVIAGIFAAVVAPVLVAFGVKFSDKVLTPAAPAATSTAAPAAAPATPAAATTSAAATPAAVTAPVVAATPAVATGPAPPPLPPNPAVSAPPALPPLPSGPPPLPGSAAPSSLANAASAPPAADAAPGGQVRLPSFKKPLSQPLRLFNGRDLTGFYTYLGHPHPKAKILGKNNDPDRVFSVKNGMLHVSGEVPGVIETEKEYTDYWLTVEYRWGVNDSLPASEAGAHSAVLLNIQGDDGIIRGAYPCSFHAQLIEGTTGDLFVASGQGEQHYSLTAAVEEKQALKLKVAYYTPGAPKTTFTQGVVRRYPPSASPHELSGARPVDSLEKPAGEWNTLDCVVLNGKIWIRLNDHVVNFATDVTPAGGRIGIQSHGADIFFREITLQPYAKHHDQSSN